MSNYVENPIYFAAECAVHDGLCSIDREHVLFLDEGEEHMAIDQLQKQCGEVVIIPDASDKQHAMLYHTSCERMTDAVQQIFQDHLDAPVRLQQPPSEMMVGEFYRRRISLPYDACRAKVESFNF